MTTLPQTSPVRVPHAITPSATPHLPAAPSAVAAFQMSGADVRRVIYANLWLIVILVVVSAVAGYALNLWLAAHYPRYTAVSFLQVDPSIMVDYLTEKTADMDAIRLVTELKTQAQLLQADRLFSDVLKKEFGRLKETKWYAQFQETDPKTGKLTFDAKAAKESLQSNFRVAPLADSKLLSVSATYSVPDDCRVIIEEIVSEHLDQQTTLARAKFDVQYKTLRDMEGSLQRELEQKSNIFATKQQDLTKRGLPAPGQFSTRETELRALLETQLKLEETAGELKSMADSTASKAKENQPIASVEKEIENDPSVATLARQVIMTDIERELKQMTLGAEHRDVKNLNEMVQIASRQLTARRDELRAKYRPQYVDEIVGRAAAAEDQLKKVRTRVDQLRAEQAEMSREVNDLQNQRDDVQALRKQQQEVQTKLRDIQVAKSPAMKARIDWAMHPETPEMPSFPKLAFTLPISVLLGLGLALGIAFLREFLDDTVRSPRDVARVGQMNLLGIIADEGDDPQAADAALPIFDAPHSLTAEQFRQVRTRLQHATSLDTTRTILVTGPSPLDGKTTVAANLAAGLALNGRKILLVDSNFRRPELHRLFEIANDKGFSDVLNGTAAFEDSIQATRIPNLSVLPSGPKPMNATELFESQLLVDFLERALEEYDHVIFDSGPFLVVSEATALAPRVDGVVTVVRAHSESRGLLLRMRDALRQVKAEHIGVVLNAVRAQGGGYYRRNIKTFYDYQAQD